MEEGGSMPRLERESWNYDGSYRYPWMIFFTRVFSWFIRGPTNCYQWRLACYLHCKRAVGVILVVGECCCSMPAEALFLVFADTRKRTSASREMLLLLFWLSFVFCSSTLMVQSDLNCKLLTLYFRNQRFRRKEESNDGAVWIVTHT